MQQHQPYDPAHISLADWRRMTEMPLLLLVAWRRDNGAIATGRMQCFVHQLHVLARAAGQSQLRELYEDSLSHLERQLAMLSQLENAALLIRLRQGLVLSEHVLGDAQHDRLIEGLNQLHGVLLGVRSLSDRLIHHGVAPDIVERIGSILADARDNGEDQVQWVA